MQMYFPAIFCHTQDIHKYGGKLRRAFYHLLDIVDLFHHPLDFNLSDIIIQFFWLRIIDDCSEPEMCVLSIFLIQTNFNGVSL